MNAVATLTRRPVTCLMLALGLCLLGATGLARLTPGLMPRVEHPGLSLITRWHGVGSERIERDITVPLERALGDLPGIRLLQSESSEGESRVSAVFARDVDVASRMQDASERVRRVRRAFPSDVEEPYIIRYDPEDRPVFVVTFAPHGSLQETRTLVDRRLKPLFERIDGVSEITVSGGFEHEIEVRSHGLANGPSPFAIQDALSRGTGNAGAGTAGLGTRRLVTYRGSLRGSAELNSLWLTVAKSSGGRLDAFAQVADRHRRPTSYARTDGAERVSLFVRKAGEANALSVSRDCRRILDQPSPDLPKAHVSYDQGLHIEEAIARLATSALYGVLAATLVLFAFLRRAAVTLITAAAIPVSVLVTFLFMFLAGIDLNLMSLSGLALGTGMLIDNAVVIVDRTESAVRGGEEARSTAEKSVVACGPELAAATLTTMVVFFPLVFLPADTRDLFADLAWTVCISLCVSLVFSLTMLPAFLAWVLRQDPRSGCATGETGRLSAPFANSLLSALERGIDFCGRVGRAVAVTALSRTKRTLLGGCALMMAGPLFYLMALKGEVGISTERSLSARVDLPTDTTLVETSQRVASVEALLREHASVEEVSARIEKAQATLQLRLRPNAPDSVLLSAELHKLANRSPDVFVTFQSAADGREPEFDIVFLGEAATPLQKFARTAASRLQAEVPGVTQVLMRFREAGRDLVVAPDRFRLFSAGLGARELGQLLRLQLSGIVATKLYNGERLVDVRLGGLDSPPARFELAALPVPTAHGPAALADLARLSEEPAPRRLTRRNRRPSATLTVRYAGSEEAVVAAVRAELDRTTFPANTTYQLDEELEARRTARLQMLWGVGAALLLVYFVLAALFESLLRPFWILLTAPLTVSVVLGLLALLRIPLQLNVYLGLVLLCGTVVNNSILIVSNTPTSATRRQILSIVRSRLRAILITTLTTLVGLLPMLLDFGRGAELFRPLAITVGLGILVGLPVSLGFVPSLLHFQARTRASKDRGAHATAIARTRSIADAQEELP